jgi:hypothetical protein
VIDQQHRHHQRGEQSHAQEISEFEIVGSKVGQIGRARAQHDDGQPIIGFRRDFASPFGPDDRQENHREREKAARMAEAKSPVLAPHMLAARIAVQ